MNANIASVRVISPAETLPLRSSVLRPGWPLDSARFPGDDDACTRHFGAFLENQLFGIASLFQAEMPEHPGVSALQLRGMATAAHVRGAGLGRALVQACVDFTRQSGVALLWCNARSPAADFYRKLCFETVGPEFVIPDVGPHFRMLFWLGQK